MIQRLIQRLEAFAIHIIMTRSSENVRKTAAIKYMSDKKRWHFVQAYKHWLNTDVRIRHLESAIIYENTILQMNLESAIEDYNNAVLNAP